MFKIAGIVVALASHTQGKQNREGLRFQGQGAGKVPTSCTIWFLFRIASSATWCSRSQVSGVVTVQGLEWPGGLRCPREDRQPFLRLS